MAGFQEVIRQWNRMCCSADSGMSCDKCKIGAKIDEEVCRNLPSEKDAELIEKEVMQWAAEHPWPVYPTWVEWLEEQGVLVNNKYWHVMNTEKMEQSIPADIAQKLGIEPKEG